MPRRTVSLLLSLSVAAAGPGGTRQVTGRSVRTARIATQPSAMPAQASTRLQPRRALLLDTENEIDFGRRFTGPAQLDRPPSFGTICLPRRVPASQNFGPRFDKAVLDHERCRLERRQREAEIEVALARAAAFVFDIGAMRDELTTNLGRPPAMFELAKAINSCGHNLTPALISQHEKEGLRAINKLFLDNQRIVPMIARKYMYSTNLDQADLVQEGNIGLLNAMRQFDPSRGVRFVSFASWYVRSRILAAIMNAHHTIRLPLGIQFEIHSIQREFKLLLEELGDEEQGPGSAAQSGRGLNASAAAQEEPAASPWPTARPRRTSGIESRATASSLKSRLPRWADSKAASDVQSRQDRLITTVAERLGWRKEKVLDRLHAYKTTSAPLSLDAPARRSGGAGTNEAAAVLGDLISCPRSAIGSAMHGDVEDVLLRDELRSILNMPLDSLRRGLGAGRERSPRNMMMMRLHYGLEDGVEYTCAQIADIFKLSVTHVYQAIQFELTMLRRLYESGEHRRLLSE